MTDGYINRDFDIVVFGSNPDASTRVSKGAWVDTTDLAGSTNTLLNDAFIEKVGFLRMLTPDTVVQIQTIVTNEYGDVIEAYESKTLEARKKSKGSQWGFFCRERDRLASYKRFMNEGMLRRVRTAVFITRALGQQQGANKKRRKVGLRNLDNALADQSRVIDGVFDLLGRNVSNASVEPMNADDLWRYYAQYLSPTHTSEIPIRVFPEHSIRENLDYSPGIPIDKEKGVFRKDGYFHEILLLRLLPKKVNALSHYKLLDCLDFNARITQSVFTLSPKSELRNEQRFYEKAVKKQGNHVAATEDMEIGLHHQRINNLKSGEVMPHRLLTAIHYWSPTLEGLSAYGDSIRTLVRKWGATYYESGMCAETRTVFDATFPGNAAFKVADRFYSAKVHSDGLAGVIALGSNYMGEAIEGQALYEGVSGNLVGVSFFDEYTPRHTFVCGATRTGKSVGTIDLMSQTDPFYDFTAIIDRGNTHGEFTKLIGGQSINVSPTSKTVINYFDTMGLPLTSVHIQSAVLMCSKMGRFAAADLNAIGLIEYYINLLYDQFLARWRKANPAKDRIARRMAYLAKELEMQKGGDTTLMDAFKMLKEQPVEQTEQQIEGITDREIQAWMDDPMNASTVKSISIAFWKHEEFPLHRNLVEQMRSLYSEAHDRTMLSGVADRLSAWCESSGRNGGMMDGYTNIDLDCRAIHAELGNIPKDNEEMLQIGYFLVTGFIRQKILGMPRQAFKRIIFEEIGIFAEVPAGEKVMADSASQLAKYNCGCVFVGQQFSQIAKTAFKSVIVGNCENYILFRQGDDSDLQALAQDIRLPKAGVEALRDFPKPSQYRKKSERQSKFLYFRSGERNSCGTCVVSLTPQMLYVAENGGKLYDERERAMAGYTNRFDGIMAETEKNMKELVGHA